MFNPFEGMPFGGQQRPYVKSYERHRLDVLGMGHEHRSWPADQDYDFDNRYRQERVWIFQYTLAGEGRLADLEQGREWNVQQGEGCLLYTSDAADE